MGNMVQSGVVKQRGATTENGSPMVPSADALEEDAAPSAVTGDAISPAFSPPPSPPTPVPIRLSAVTLTAASGSAPQGPVKLDVLVAETDPLSGDQFGVVVSSTSAPVDVLTIKPFVISAGARTSPLGQPTCLDQPLRCGRERTCADHAPRART